VSEGKARERRWKSIVKTLYLMVVPEVHEVVTKTFNLYLRMFCLLSINIEKMKGGIKE